MITREEFLAQIEAFLTANEDEWTATAFGRHSIGDPMFVFNVRNGRTPSIATAQKVLAFMESNPVRPKKKGRAA